MSLRLQAAADLLAITGDVSGGFGWLITVTTPTGQSAVISGLSTDIGESLDPETGMIVAGRKASVALPIASLVAVGITTLPSAAPDASKKPWVIRFADVAGNAHTFAVKHAMPDTAIGLVTCILEQYRG
jgi:hypothetical protein